MQLRYFVTLCSLALVGWLALTFVHEVPSQRYRKVTTEPSVVVADPVKTVELVEGKESSVVAVSVSR